MNYSVVAVFIISICTACLPFPSFLSAPVAANDRMVVIPTPTERALTPIAAPLAVAAPNAEAQKLVQVLDAMQVETHWLKGVGVDWKTGSPDGRSVPLDDTHCSAFVAAVSAKLDVNLLRPPEHSTKLLANAQNEWLNNRGAEFGWERVMDGGRAQELANQGYFVIASYRNPDPQKSGHIAVVRPSDKSIAAIRTEGPQVTQAGSHNYSSAPLKQGFSGPLSAFSRNRIQFFAHPLNLQ
jgi:hypothetical protein